MAAAGLTARHALLQALASLVGAEGLGGAVVVLFDRDGRALPDFGNVTTGAITYHDLLAAAADELRRAAAEMEAKR
jgi:hypothetical protein